MADQPNDSPSPYDPEAGTYRPEVVVRLTSDPEARWSDYDDLTVAEVSAVADLETWSRDLLGATFSKALAFANALHILMPWMRGDQSIRTALKIAPHVIVQQALEHLRSGGWTEADGLPPRLEGHA